MFAGTVDYSGAATTSASNIAVGGTSAYAMSAVIDATYKTKAFDMSTQNTDRINVEKQFLKTSVQGSMTTGSIGMKSEVDSGGGSIQVDTLNSEAEPGFILDTSVLDVDSLGSGVDFFSHEIEMGVEMAGKTLGFEFTAKDLAQAAEIDSLVIGYRDKWNRG